MNLVKPILLLTGAMVKSKNLQFILQAIRMKLTGVNQQKRQIFILQKGYAKQYFLWPGYQNYQFEISENDELDESQVVSVNGKNIAVTGAVNKLQLEKFSIKQPVYFICFDWENLMSFSTKN